MRYQRDLYEQSMRLVLKDMNDKVNQLQNELRIQVAKISQYEIVVNEILPQMTEQVRQLNLKFTSMLEQTMMLPEYELFARIRYDGLFARQAVLIGMKSVRDAVTALDELSLSAGNYFQGNGQAGRDETLELYRRSLFEQEEIIEREEGEIASLQKLLQRQSLQTRLDAYRERLRIRQEVEAADMARRRCEELNAAVDQRAGVAAAPENQQTLIKTYIDELDPGAPALINDIIASQLTARDSG